MRIKRFLTNRIQDATWKIWTKTLTQRPGELSLHPSGQYLGIVLPDGKFLFMSGKDFKKMSDKELNLIFQKSLSKFM